MHYTLAQILADKKGALKEHKDATKDKNKKGYHVATKQAVDGDIVKAVANTFWFFDYDADVLTPQSVDETIKNRDIPIYHLKDHKFNTDGLIGEIKSVKVDIVNTEEFGSTNALVFESQTSGFEWYKKGVISQHSIGFRYLDIELATREGDGEKENQLYINNIDKIINKDEVEEIGYFYLVNKINLFEISAVLRGANRLTSVLKSTDSASEKTAAQLLNKLNFKL